MSLQAEGELAEVKKELNLTKAKLSSALPMLPEMERRRLEAEVSFICGLF